MSVQKPPLSYNPATPAWPQSLQMSGWQTPRMRGLQSSAHISYSTDGKMGMEEVSVLEALWLIGGPAQSEAVVLFSFLTLPLVSIKQTLSLFLYIEIPKENVLKERLTEVCFLN